ncbi:MAG: hypothetical protein KJO40_06135 [Deltaproteobacteria bacterium]|nr:hypothetical protein [Deltaproteobacteria bacterium]MBT8465635.1 hypothetical protein [Deltaproteobacteria bacterium]NND30488.1 hypothetical protein [Myxococcales bacterium]RZV54174.1 MAG: hypothetical protein EX268_06935 [Deltaproteobacteria bacterium]
MYAINDAHPVTVLVIIAAFLVTPIYALATYVFSGASKKKGLRIGAAFLVFGTLMFWVCIADVPRRLDLAGNLIVPAAWILPSLILYIWRDWFLDRWLCQKWLIGLQLFRAIGGVFLIEMVRGNVPGIFAYPAGLGDLGVAFVAAAVLIKYWNAARIPGAAVALVIALGVADFLSAFFFGLTSSESPVQLFFPEEPSRLIVFPTGLIPLFLVPYAIFFHTLSWLSYRKFNK